MSNDSQTPPPSRLSPTQKSTPKEDPKGSATDTSSKSSTDPAEKSAPAGQKPADQAPAKPAPGAQPDPKDPLRGSKASGFWATVVFLVIVLVLLAIFVLQNTDSVTINFLGWSGRAPLAAAMMISAAAGLVLAVAAGTARIFQLRHRVKRDRKVAKKANAAPKR